MMQDFYTADVFTTRPFQGAQIAVFPHADALKQDEMQRIAAELNLSETVFVSAGDRAARRRRLRIFSPQAEVDFGGHPIIATGHVLASIGDIELDGDYTAMVFEQNHGEVEVHIKSVAGRPEQVQFSMPVSAVTDAFVPMERELADILGLETAELGHDKLQALLSCCGKNYLIVPLRDYNAVRKARFNYRAWSQSSAPATLAREILLVTTTPGPGRPDFHARLLGPEIGAAEDPPVGSSMPAFTAYLARHPHIKRGTYPFSIDRGTETTRRSVLNIEMDNRGEEELAIRVGGPAVMMSQGRFLFADRVSG